MYGLDPYQIPNQVMDQFVFLHFFNQTHLQKELQSSPEAAYLHFLHPVVHLASKEGPGLQNSYSFSKKIFPPNFLYFLAKILY